MEIHPDSVITDDSGYLRVSMPGLMQQDAVIATLVTDVGTSTIARWRLGRLIWTMPVG